VGRHQVALSANARNCSGGDGTARLQVRIARAVVGETDVSPEAFRRVWYEFVSPKDGAFDVEIRHSPTDGGDRTLLFDAVSIVEPGGIDPYHPTYNSCGPAQLLGGDPPTLFREATEGADTWVFLDSLANGQFQRVEVKIGDDLLVLVQPGVAPRVPPRPGETIRPMDPGRQCFSTSVAIRMSEGDDGTFSRNVDIGLVGCPYTGRAPPCPRDRRGLLQPRRSGRGL